MRTYIVIAAAACSSTSSPAPEPASAPAPVGTTETAPAPVAAPTPVAEPAPAATGSAPSLPDTSSPQDGDPPGTEKLERARTAGFLGSESLEPGGAFASLVGADDITGVRPTLTIGKPTVSPGLAPATVIRHIKRERLKFEFCYVKQLLEDAALAGTVTATFTISPDGTVASAEATGLAGVETCVAAVIRLIYFPKTRDDAEVTVTYPFVYALTP